MELLLGGGCFWKRAKPFGTGGGKRVDGREGVRFLGG
jgi:hypothetical protein